MKKVIFRTSGMGYWSNIKTKVPITQIMLDNNKHCPELMVHFDTVAWDNKKNGLIYTDGLWLSDLRDYLVRLGFSRKAVYDIDYSEAGMQGNNYVSLDAGKSFLKEWKRKKLLAVLT